MKSVAYGFCLLLVVICLYTGSTVHSKLAMDTYRQLILMSPCSKVSIIVVHGGVRRYCWFQLSLNTEAVQCMHFTDFISGLDMFVADKSCG